MAEHTAQHGAMDTESHAATYEFFLRIMVAGIIHVFFTMVALATELINRKAAEFEPQKYHNHYAEALQELVKEKAKGRKIVTAEEPEPAHGTVVNLMDALRKSVQSGGKAAAPAAGAPATKAPAKSQTASKRKTGSRR